MPTVPTYQGGLIVADIGGIPRQVGLSQSAFGIGQPTLSDAASKALDVAAGFFEDQKKLRDADMVNRAEVEFAKSEQDFRDKMSQRQGFNASGVTKDTEKWLEEKHRSTMNALENDDQRRVFSLKVSNRAVSLRGDAMKFEGDQQKNSYAESKSAQVNVAISDAAANPAKMPESKAKIDSILSDIAGIKGWGEDQYQGERLKYTSMLHEQVIQSLNRQNPEAAKAYFEANKGEIDGTKHDNIIKGYEANDRLNRIQSFADGITSNMTREQATAEARKQFSGQDEVLAINEVHQRYNEMDKAIKDKQDTQLAPVNTLLADSLLNKRMISRAQQQQILAGLADSPELKHSAATAMFNHNNTMESEYKQGRAEVDAARTQAKYAKFLEISSPEALDRMSEADIIKLLPDMGSDLTGRLMTSKRNLAKGDNKVLEAKIDDDDFKLIAHESGLSPFATGNSEADKAKLGKIKASIENRVDAEQTLLKRPLNREEKKRLMTEEFDNAVMIPHLYGDTKTPVSLATKEDLQDAYVLVGDKKVKVSSIPADKRAKAIQLLKSRNLPVSESTIADVYINSGRVAVGKIK